jgi:hypothetical protein
MPGLESELDSERGKTMARWFGIAILGAFILQQKAQGVLSVSLTVWLAVVGTAVLMNTFHTLFLFRSTRCPRAYKYFSTGLDLLIVSMAVKFTGYNQSPFFYVYFLLLISNCIRYGLLMSIYIASMVNIFYAITLSLAPDLPPTLLGGEGLKILAFWGVALYGGSVAGRLRRHANEMIAYEETIAELKQRLQESERPSINPVQDSAEGSQ